MQLLVIDRQLMGHFRLGHLQGFEFSNVTENHNHTFGFIACVTAGAKQTCRERQRQVPLTLRIADRLLMPNRRFINGVQNGLIELVIALGTEKHLAKALSLNALCRKPQNTLGGLVDSDKGTAAIY